MVIKDIKIGIYFINSQKERVKIVATLQRYTAPRTLEKLLRALPLKTRGRFYVGNDGLYMLHNLDLKMGAEKSSEDEIARGAVVYEPKQDALFIALRALVPPEPVNNLGSVTSSLDALVKDNFANGQLVAVHQLET